MADDAQAYFRYYPRQQQRPDDQHSNLAKLVPLHSQVDMMSFLNNIWPLLYAHLANPEMNCPKEMNTVLHLQTSVP